MLLEIRLNSRALRASNSSFESQELGGSGMNVLEDELVEVAPCLVGVSTIGASSPSES